MKDFQLNQRWELLACALFAGILLAFIFFYATTPISDPDFGWHLKSGEVMVKTGGLLQSDPFTFTGNGVVTTREALVLQGYWLWQVTAYGLYTLFGLNGIFLLNFLTVGAMAVVVAQQMRRQQVGYALAVLLMTLGFVLLRGIYPLERPQVVSFLFAAILLGFIARVRDGGRLGWSLPLLMVVWANMHGGFVVGDLILLCFAAGAVIEYRHDLPRLRHLLTWVGIGIGASLLNPTGILVFGELFRFQNSELMQKTSEFQSTWLLFNQGLSIVLILWVLIALYGIGLWSARRLFWPELIVALFLAWFSAAYVRNVAFFALAMLPAIGFYLQSRLLRHSRTIPRLWGVFIILFAAAGLLWQTSEHWHGSAKELALESFYPEGASQFIQSSGLQGRMFNGYNFGGYLIWKLYPQHRIFIDTRAINIDVFRDWKAITSASLQEVGGRKEFEVLLDRYDIDYVVQSHLYHDTGRLTPLLKFLLIKPEWIPVYVDQQGYILVRHSAKNATVIERFRMEKGDFNNKVIGFLTASGNSRPAEVMTHVALAEMLIFVGRYAEAENRLAVIARLQPDNPDLPSLRNQLTVLKNGNKP